LPRQIQELVRRLGRWAASVRGRRPLGRLGDTGTIQLPRSPLHLLLRRGYRLFAEGFPFGFVRALELLFGLLKQVLFRPGQLKHPLAESDVTVFAG
jgi:hypothetical protein